MILDPLVLEKQYDSIEGVLLPEENLKLFGHKKNKAFFEELLKSKNLPHAFLFQGEKGIGKATFSFHFIWNLLSGKDSFSIPKEEDVVWRQMAQKVHPSFLHVKRSLDRKTKNFRSAITVENIEDIHNFLGKTVQRGSWRVVLIDDANDMNRNAANALLKILENPPQRTLFILLSLAPNKLLPTIRSRCQYVHFSPLTTEEVFLALNHCCPAMDMDKDFIEKKVLLDHAGGSVRDAALLLLSDFLENWAVLENILKHEVLNYSLLYPLAADLAKKENLSKYIIFKKEILNYIACQSKAEADQLNMERAMFWQKYWFALQKEFFELETYNLDKKNFIGLLIERIHKFIYKTNR